MMINRRNFLINTAIVPAIIATPTIVLSSTRTAREECPGTVDELYECVNKHCTVLSHIHMLEEVSLRDAGFEYLAYRLGNSAENAEERLVGTVWNYLSRRIDGNPNRSPTVFWRQYPRIYDNYSILSGSHTKLLTMRLGYKP